MKKKSAAILAFGLAGGSYLWRRRSRWVALVQDQTPDLREFVNEQAPRFHEFMDATLPALLPFPFNLEFVREGVQAGIERLLKE